MIVEAPRAYFGSRLTRKLHIVTTCAFTRQKARKMRFLLRPGSGLSITATIRFFNATLMP